MSDVLKFRSLAELEEVAAAWVWRLDDDDISPEVRSEFEQWLRLDSRHRRAFEELGGIWQALDELADAKRDEKVATFVAEEKRLYAMPAKAERRHLHHWLAWAAAASLVFAAVGLSWYQRADEVQTLATAVGQQRSATLVDGSVVQLNTNTIVETRYTADQREVYLKKGEAIFTVEKDPDRPFLVHAGNMLVRAVGTEFNVRLRETQDVEITVTEGKVEVVSQTSGNAKRFYAVLASTETATARTELTVGQRFEPAGASPVVQMAPVVVANSLAWREGAIVFDGEPLVEAVVELNRYTDTKLVVADASIQGLRVGGRFRTGDVDGFLEALTRAFPVTTHRTSDNLVYINARTSPTLARQ